MITVDVDWAPEWAIERLALVIESAGVASTWFATHDSKALSDFAVRNNNVELGVHPNFLTGSSHGESNADVIRHCLELVPKSTSMRTHCLYQSTPMYQDVCDQSEIYIDASMYTGDVPSNFISVLPLSGNKSILKVPFVWEDDLNFVDPQRSWNARDFLLGRSRNSAFTVINVHPIHFGLNSNSSTAYNSYREALPSFPLDDKEIWKKFQNLDSEGTMTFLTEALAMAESESFDYSHTLTSFVGSFTRVPRL